MNKNEFVNGLRINVVLRSELTPDIIRMISEVRHEELGFSCNTLETISPIAYTASLAKGDFEFALTLGQIMSEKMNELYKQKIFCFSDELINVKDVTYTIDENLDELLEFKKNQKNFSKQNIIHEHERTKIINRFLEKF